MKTHIFLILSSLMVLIATSCGVETMCTENADCRNMCLTYENNDLMYACVDNACQCVTHEALVCAGEDSDYCKEICDTYYPGTIGACIMAKCECVSPEE